MKTATLWLAAGFAASVTMGCGGDDTVVAPPDAGRDATSDVFVPPAPEGGADTGGGDTGANDAPSGDAPTEGGACNYATFVLGLIADHTTSSDLPSTDLGQGCVDDQDQAEFKSLFP